MGKLRVQDVGEGNVKIRFYGERIVQGPLRGTPVIFKVYPGQQVGGTEADMMAANELNAHTYLQSSSKTVSQNLQVLLGGFETKMGEQEQLIKRRRFFIVKLLHGALRGSAYVHDLDRLHQSHGPASVVLNTMAEREVAYLIPRLRDLAFSVDISYCLADDRFLEAVKFLDLGGGAGWELLKVMLHPDFRLRPIAEAVLNHGFMTGAVL